ncbi:Uncharacterised protein [Legionella busanensis]|uniref:Uncharacterized protein n=1 Tax=Legionella busanensis TaxID=190655 RepID=A0A378KDW5_9GAMM|nr:hypothetical protein [Legionella busanensis]STX81422.1 Uncharacterised protein [Legionella busanensis]
MLRVTSENNRNESNQLNQCLPLLTYTTSIGGACIGVIGSILVTPLEIVAAGAGCCSTITNACNTGLVFFSAYASGSSRNVADHSVSVPLLMNRE